MSNALRLLQLASHVWLAFMMAVVAVGVIGRLDGNRIVSVHNQALWPALGKGDVVLVQRTAQITPGQMLSSWLGIVMVVYIPATWVLWGELKRLRLYFRSHDTLPH
jgi:hypothetical protein